MIEPALKDDALLADIRECRVQRRDWRLWWLGQSGFLIQYHGRHLLIDPYLSDSLTRKYAASDKPHERLTCLAIDPARLGFIDVVTSSHNHTDHLDSETLRPLFAANPHLQMVCSEANRAVVAERAGIERGKLIGVTEAAAASAGGFEFIGIPSAHNAVDRDAAGHPLYMGFVIRFGPWTIYHSGDTLRYQGLAERLAGYKVDVALLPINGNRPERRVAGNLDGREAAQLAHDIGARLVIPCHYEMFAFNTAGPEEQGGFVAECAKLHQPCRVLRCGERWTSSEIAGAQGE
ncbi:MAG TPA: MBL fold metallo-hydrolase [Tepidisphaeraceae bacterium]|jgi:L-ascorbate metabolism protein UlaG (beta-lactamase superfamily)